MDQNPLPPTPPPPPPTGGQVTPPAPVDPPRVAAHDNPIAIAALVVAVVALVLSIVVIGFFLGVVAIVLAIIALRRARQGRRGRGLAIGGILVALLAMAFSIGALLIMASILRSGDTIVRDGIATTSDNTEDPPQDDIDGIECTSSNSGRLAQAKVTITNRSEGRSVYRIAIEWDSPGGPIREVVSTGYVSVDETATYQVVDLSGAAIEDSCRVTEIDRSFLPVF